MPSLIEQTTCAAMGCASPHVTLEYRIKPSRNKFGNPDEEDKWWPICQQCVETYNLTERSNDFWLRKYEYGKPNS